MNEWMNRVFYAKILQCKAILGRGQTSENVNISSIRSSISIFSTSCQNTKIWMVLYAKILVFYTGPGTTWANEMIFYESCPPCRIDRSARWPAVRRTITVLRMPPDHESGLKNCAWLWLLFITCASPSLRVCSVISAVSCVLIIPSPRTHGWYKGL